MHYIPLSLPFFLAFFFLFEPVGVDSGQGVYECGFAMIHMASRSNYAHGFLLLGIEYRITEWTSKPF